MKKAKPINEHEEERLPFSFLKKDFDKTKIKAHWRTIEEKIKPELPEPTGNEEKSDLM